jgi:hypothetical protein
LLIEKPVFKTDREIEEEFCEHVLDAEQQLGPALPYRITRGDYARLEQELLRFRRMLHLFRATIQRHEGRIAFLESQIKTMQEHEGDKAMSDDNVRMLRLMFGLPEIAGEVREDVLGELEGILGEYSEEGLNSVELLRSIRSE